MARVCFFVLKRTRPAGHTTITCDSHATHTDSYIHSSLHTRASQCRYTRHHHRPRPPLCQCPWPPLPASAFTRWARSWAYPRAWTNPRRRKAPTRVPFAGYPWWRRGRRPTLPTRSQKWCASNRASIVFTLRAFDKRRRCIGITRPTAGTGCGGPIAHCVAPPQRRVWAGQRRPRPGVTAEHWRRRPRPC